MKRRAFVSRLGAGVLACALLRDALLGGAPEVEGMPHDGDMMLFVFDGSPLIDPGTMAELIRLDTELIRALGVPEPLLTGQRLVMRSPRWLPPFCTPAP